jgi:hypothetical protein
MECRRERVDHQREISHGHPAEGRLELHREALALRVYHLLVPAGATIALRP